MNSAIVEDDDIHMVDKRIFKSLAVVLLELAAVELSRPLPDSRDTSARAEVVRRNAANAERWIKGGASGANVLVTFDFCCDVLNIDPQAVRTAMMTDAHQLVAKLRAVALSVQSAENGRTDLSVRVPRPH